MAELFHTYLHAGLFGSVMILLILLLRPLLRKAPRNTLCVLWMLAAVRLLLPFQMESKFSLQPQFSPYQPTVITSVEETQAEFSPTVTPEIQTVPNVLPEPIPVAPDTQLTPDLLPDSAPVYPEPEITPDPLPDSDPVAETLPIASDVETRKAIDYTQILSAIWMGGALIILLYAVVSYGVLRFKVSEAVRCADGAMECDRIKGAFLLGYFKPEIYLPTGLSQRDRGFIMAHERVHMKRGDHWWKLLGLLCVCVHWYNPLVWLAYALLCRDIEVACDEQVIRFMQLEERKAYSFALLNSGKRMASFFLYPVSFGEVSLKQRIKNVLSYRKPGFWITAIAISLVAFVVVCFMTTPKSTSGGNGQSPSAKTQVTTHPVTEPTELPTTEATEPPTTEATEPPTTEVTEPPTTEVTEPPTTEVTEPPTTEPTEPPTTEVTEPPTTEPTEPPISESTEPPTAEPTEPPATEPTEPSADHPDQPAVVAEGKWSGGPVRWKITADGTLTISGNRSIQGSSEYIWKDYSDIITKIVVEDGITSIPRYAFSEMSNVTEVYLSNTLEKFYEYAFYRCTSLRSVTIPAAVTEIPQFTFAECSRLTTLQFAPNCQITTIGQYAFSKTGIVSFSAPASLRVIDFHAFENCKSMQTLILEGGVEEVKAHSFRNCTNLKHMVLGESIRSIHSPFDGVGSVETLQINIAGEYDGFRDWKALKSVSIGGKVKTIRHSWFAGCTSLSSVTITAPITEIGSRAFENCTSLAAITLPDTVSVIGISAFGGTGLTEITIPGSVREMGWSVFTNSSLKKLVFEGDIPVMDNNSAFRDVAITVYYPADNETWTEDKLQDYGGDVTWIAQ